MWSHIYDYYEIRLSATYDRTVDTATVRAVIDVQVELEQHGLLVFHNAVGFPWIDLCIVKSSNGNFACSTDTWTDECNLIPIVCSKSKDGRIPAEQLVFLFKIAQQLGWQLVHETTEEGEENVVLWSPF